METQPLAVIGVVALLLAGGVGYVVADTGGAPSATAAEPTAENATVSVGADATVERAPDEATVTVAAVGRGETAAAARTNVSGDADAIRSALEDEGATVTSSRFSVRPEYDYSQDGRELVGYVAVHTIEAETTDVDRVGTLVDTTVDSGADRVQGITYSLSDETRSDAREQALTTAMDRARGDATTLATAEDRSVGDAVTIQTNDGGQPVVRAEYATAADGGGQTNISPGPVTVEVSVHVTYELE
ncbi:SIMPL domain-containing protein [Haloarcula salinisoli]|uniref:SIMPL domain-containing protein n=1 Tax=Haloarcula salinisoli TaxID=2487746 RepID=A0A8J7YGW6_9EURY|nr:SIMPL domain-containing protein [Halomicroarcula salinisoli]MBX0288152.1 SIMPL domain-containing protein [Halomicroarcula salinisoli]MBX0305302.1 SIMPL domain-containing protein [Halomicroarcula salinisoli]